ncbi:hypothetical protein [Listeria monocytogenes]|uniref:hypothetical protein n=1 Tax=Listeria monocytogenes TaxID=1639 RepID=UPI001F334A01|nr:hypothetical protein [Listeria monocytogenes]
MKKTVLKPVMVSIIVGLLVITPITHVSAAVKDVDVTPILTQKEVESGVQDITR